MIKCGTTTSKIVVCVADISAHSFPSSTDIDILSQPTTPPSHPDAPGTLWHHAQTHKGLIYLQRTTFQHKFQVTWTEDMVQCAFQNEKLQREVGVSFLHIHEYHPENQSSYPLFETKQSFSLIQNMGNTGVSKNRLDISSPYDVLKGKQVLSCSQLCWLMIWQIITNSSHDIRKQWSNEEAGHHIIFQYSKERMFHFVKCLNALWCLLLILLVLHLCARLKLEEVRSKDRRQRDNVKTVN